MHCTTKSRAKCDGKFRLLKMGSFKMIPYFSYCPILILIVVAKLELSQNDSYWKCWVRSEIFY